MPYSYASKDLYTDFQLKKADIIINTELEKPTRKINAQLIEKCFSRIESLQPNFLSEEEVKESIAKITSIKQKEQKKLPLPLKKGLKKFVFVPISACLSVLLFVFLLTPSIYSEEDNLMLKYMDQISQLGPGDKFVYENHEIITLFDVEYIPPEQIEEVLYFSDYGYLYPSYLPEDKEIRSLLLVHDDDTADYLFKNPVPFFGISMKPADGKFDDEYDTYVGKYKCLFYDNTIYGRPCSVLFEYNGTRYQVSARSKEEAIKIIEGMI